MRALEEENARLLEVLREIERKTGVGPRPPLKPGQARPRGEPWYDLLVQVNAIAKKAQNG